MHSMAKCAVRRTALWLRLWFYIIQGFTNMLWKKSFSMAKCGINIFFIVIYHSSLVKGAMNAACVWKLRNGVKKTPQISSFFNGQRWTKCAVNILRSYLNWWHNWQLKSRRRSHTLKGSHLMENGRIFLKTCRDVSFNPLPHGVLASFRLTAGGLPRPPKEGDI